MNFLAHFHLADPQPDARFGNILADFVRGSDFESYQPPVQRGILQHRALDAYTDAHPVFRSSAALLKPRWGRYSMVLMDMITDHFLARDWSTYSPRPLEEFAAECHLLLDGRRDLMPPPMQATMKRLVEQQWFLSYRRLDGMEEALRRLSRRFRFRPVDLSPAIGDVEAHYEELRQRFHEFYPEAVSFARGLHGTDGTPAEQAP